MRDLSRHLRTERYGRELLFLEDTASTNDVARQRSADPAVPDGYVVVADRQSMGRGARGRVWSSPAGTDLYFSIVARRVPEPAAALPPLTLAVGVGVARALESLVEARPVEVKWPNDVRIEDRKCAGILVETVSSGPRVESVILGIGLNVNRAKFEGELEATATSLRQVAGRDFDRARVLAEVLLSVEREVSKLREQGPRPIIEELQRRLCWRDRRVRVGEHEGTLLGVADDGALRLVADGEERRVLAGTLRLR